MNAKANVSEEINHLFRHEYGKLVSVLTKSFGVHQLQLAEDVVQEAMADALEQWSYTEMPENPVGWIYKVAKHKAINILNRDKLKFKHQSEVLHTKDSKEDFDEIFSEKEITDDQLRMIFTCCHPSISQDSQVALTLKTLCGFSIPEISNAFLSSNENINKRLVRARKQLKESDIAYAIPTGAELDKRLDSVLEIIYLLFNEGYHASHGPNAIRFELCEEAIRLAELVGTHSSIIQKDQVASLLALMCFNAARFDARIDADENLIDLENQDRKLWNQSLISRGVHHLNSTVSSGKVSKYQILAAISANHCTARDYASTNWQAILNLYDYLLQMDASPIVKLNRAVALSLCHTPQEGLDAISELDEGALSNYIPYFTVKAELLLRNGEHAAALTLLNAALALEPNELLADEIRKKIAGLN